MADKRWYDGKWIESIEWDDWRFIKPGWYDPEVQLEPNDFQHFIPKVHIQMLIRVLDEAGWIKPRLDERLRAEDLKITHRLLDIIAKQVGGG